MADRHITRINDTLTNIITGIDDHQICIVTDDGYGELAWRDGYGLNFPWITKKYNLDSDDWTYNDLGIGTDTTNYTLDALHATDNIIGQFTSGDLLASLKISDSGTSAYVSAYDYIATTGQRFAAIGGYADAANVKNLMIDLDGNVTIGLVANSGNTYRFTAHRGTGNNIANFVSATDTGYIKISDDDTDCYVMAKDTELSLGITTTIGNNLNIASGKMAIGASTSSMPLYVYHGSDSILAKFKSNNDLSTIVISDDDTDVYVVSKDSTMSLGIANTLSTINFNIISGKVGIGVLVPLVPVHAVTSSIEVARFEASTANASISVKDSTQKGSLGIIGTKMYIGASGTTFSNDITFDISTYNMGVHMTSPSDNADLALGNGVLQIAETTTPTADTGFGKLYCKADDMLYFQDGYGDEHEISPTAFADYSGTSTIVGWSSYGVKRIYYKKIANRVFVDFRISGPSDSTSTTFTLPDTCKNSTEYLLQNFVRITDNSIEAYGWLEMTGNGTTVTVYPDVAGNAWTAGGAGKIIIGSFSYEAE